MSITIKLKILHFIFLICLLQNSISQKYGMFKDLGKVILFADTLKANKSIEVEINKINNDTSVRKKLLGDYNLAICYVAKSDTDSACFYLSRSIVRVQLFNRLILSDTDFNSMHESSCWKAIADKIDSVHLAATPHISNQKLSLELFHIFVLDQKARGYGLKFPDMSLKNVDSLNIIRIEEIIKEHGWPTYSMVGKVAADGAFMVIQHSTTAIQKKYLPLLLEAAKKKEASGESVALLKDRIMAAEEHVQYYGTQVFQVKNPQTGKLSRYTYYPIKDEANVDIRRKEMGLIPLKDYLKKFRIDYVAGSKFQPPTFE